MKNESLYLAEFVNLSDFAHVGQKFFEAILKLSILDKYVYTHVVSKYLNKPSTYAHYGPAPGDAAAQMMRDEGNSVKGRYNFVSVQRISVR